MILWLSGCSGSSPRFSTHETKDEPQQEHHRKGNIRFSSKESREERKEDDRKIDINAVAHRFSSAGRSGNSIETKPHAEKSIVPPAAPVTAATFDHQKMMDLILAWMGTPYEYGGDSKSGIDCSAFTKEMYSDAAGINLPRTCEEQAKLGSPVQKDGLKFGDLIFFNTTGQNPSHVAIYIGDDMFAHASVSFGVTLSSMYSSYYKKRYTEARRIIQ